MRSIGWGSFQNPLSGLEACIDPRRLRVGDDFGLVLAEGEVQFVTSLIEGVIRISGEEALRAAQVRPQGQEFVPKLLDPDLKVSGGREVFPECLEDENLQCLDYCPLRRVLGLRLYIFDKNW